MPAETHHVLDETAGRIHPIQLVQVGKLHDVPSPLVRVRTCGGVQLEVLREVTSTDPPQGRYQIVTLHQRPKGSSTALTLLKILASLPEHYASKDWLTEHLPRTRSTSDAEDEEDWGHGLIRVDNIVSLLRSLLCPLGIDGEEVLRKILIAYVRNHRESGPGYRLATEPLVWLDVDVMAASVKHALRHEQEGNEALPAWEQISALASKGVYLSDEPYSDWAKDTRLRVEGYVHQAVHALRRLYLSRENEGGEEQAIILLRSYWQTHLTDEDVLRSLMELLSKHNGVQEALECYQRLCERLALKGGIPDPRTQKTAQNVLHFEKSATIYTVEAHFPHKVDSPSAAEQQDEVSLDFSQAVKRGIIEAVCELVGNNMDQLRRQCLQTVLTTVSTALLIPKDILLCSTEPISSVQLGTPLLRLYNYLLSLSWEHYYTRSSQSLVSIVDDCLSSLSESIKNACGNEQIQLLSLLCRFYQLSGVVARDRMDITRALKDGKKSIELAFTTDNTELIAASLFRRAKTYLKQQRYDQALQDLEAALIYARHARDPLRGYIHQAVAEAYTNTGASQDQYIHKKCLTLLDSVEYILHNGNLDDDGSFVKVNIAGLSMDRATVLTHFQKPQEARRTLDVAVQHLGTELTRWQSRLLIANAETYLAEDNAQGCCDILFTALKKVRAMNSRSNEMRVDALYQRLHALYPYQPLVRQLGEQLHSS